MARYRRQHDGLEFGADSFLDIIANIVGILIILIVITGVRVSLAPPKKSARSVEVPPEAALLVETQVEVPLVEQPEVKLEELPVVLGETALVEPISQEVALPEIQLGTTGQFETRVDPSLLSRIESQAKMVQEAKLKLQQTSETVSQRKQEQADFSAQMQRIQEQVQKLETEQNQLRLKQNQVRTEYASLMNEQARLSEQLVLVQRKASPAQTIQHAMVPMSRQVSGHEWHFELRDGKVSFIPLDELLGQVKQKVERWAEWIAKYDRHESNVGPIEGYSLEYKVSRQKGSLSQELTGGDGTFRIGIDRWELVPTGQVHAETLEQARNEHSNFRSTLNRCSFDDTITLWVYPDSFDMYQELSRIAHEMGYQVAGRPLPAGRRIGGSPQGSKSLGQ